MIANVLIANDLIEIFRELFVHHYPIEKMRLVDNWDADDERAMRDNNSSAFNFRFVSHTKRVSKHGIGMAVDINPLYNPYYKRLADGREIIEPATGKAYLDRAKVFPYKITKGDLCHKLFIQHGFTWGGEWRSCKDYQHFERRLPSTPKKDTNALGAEHNRLPLRQTTFPILITRMMFQYLFPQIFAVDMHIDFSRRYLFMSQHLLNGS